MTSLSAVSPIDGRYRSKTKQLSAYFSEEALIRYRILVEVEYFIALYEEGLPQLQDVNATNFPKLRELYQNFTSIDAQAIKKIESHDCCIDNCIDGIVIRCICIFLCTVLRLFPFDFKFSINLFIACIVDGLFGKATKQRCQTVPDSSISFDYVHSS